MAPSAYPRLTRFALWSLAAIVVTGAAVRLTGSGLGCTDWPACTEDRLVPDLEYHALVEFVNRLFTGVVAVAVVGAVLGSMRRVPRRRDLAWWSWGLVAGVAAQVGLGALLVATELDPRFTMGHFLLSMVLIANAVVLDEKARDGLEAGAGESSARDRPDEPVGLDTRTRPGEPVGLDTRTRLGLAAIVAVGAGLLVTGTIVTGAGPHAGDSRAERLPFLVQEVTRIHGLVAVGLFAIVAATWYGLRSRADRAELRRRLRAVAGLLAVQGAVGYTQYFTGVPVLLVGIHIALATLIWMRIVQAAMTARPWRPGPVPEAAAV